MDICVLRCMLRCSQNLLSLPVLTLMSSCAFCDTNIRLRLQLWVDQAGRQLFHLIWLLLDAESGKTLPNLIHLVLFIYVDLNITFRSYYHRYTHKPIPPPSTHPHSDHYISLLRWNWNFIVTLYWVHTYEQGSKVNANCKLNDLLYHPNSSHLLQFQTWSHIQN